MNRNHIWALIAMSIMTLSCSSSTQKAEAEKPVNNTQVAENQDKYQQDYIEKRLKAIFNDAYSNGKSCIENDSLFCSQEYNTLQNKAIAIAESNEYVLVDNDHWSQSQDPQNPQMTIKKIYNINKNNKTATADIEVTNKYNRNEPSAVTLQLILENDDWFIDNWVIYWEGDSIDEKDFLQQYINNGGKVE